jgi:hypothetical protein
MACLLLILVPRAYHCGVAVTNTRQSRSPAYLPAKPVPRTWLYSFPARVALRAVTATLGCYWRAFVFAVEHNGHEQFFSIHPGRARVICECGDEKWV